MLLLLERRSSCELLERNRLMRRSGSRGSGGGGGRSSGGGPRGLVRTEALLGGRGESGTGEMMVDWRWRPTLGFRGSGVLLEATDTALELVRRVRPEEAWLPTRGLESF